MGAQNFNFAPKFFKTGVFSPKFCIFNKNVPTKRKFSENFSTVQNLGRGNIAPCPSPAIMPLFLRST